ncbi:MAG: glycosyltransferase [Clostridia bacterium]|nr:glycosyltransferase [Clostridia bacterium]
MIEVAKIHWREAVVPMTGKKILIVSNNFHVGGVQKSLYNLLWNLSGQYDISLILFYCGKDERSYIPENVQLIPLCSPYHYLGMTRHDADGNIRDKIGRFIFAAVTRMFGRHFTIRLMSVFQKPIYGYDVVISFLHNGESHLFYGGCNDFVLRHVKGTKKVAFLHCDYEKSGANTKENARAYELFDVIAACSRGCADSFLRVLPCMEHKVITLPNFCRFEEIRHRAEQMPTLFEKGYFHIVTVARLGKEKGVFRAVEAIATLGALKEHIRYYIVGDGVERDAIEAAIDRHGLSEIVTLCGEMKNPYGMMKAADLLLIPSYSEAAPMVIGEAACLGTPILSTETSSAHEMITNVGYGWVCDNSVSGIADKLIELLRNPDNISATKKYLAECTFDNHVAFEQFSKIVE